MPPPRSPGERFVRRLAAVLLGLLLALASFEGVLRVIGFDPVGEYVRQKRGLFLRPSNDPLREYELTPGYSGKAWGVQVDVNSLGMRGPERTLDKPEGAFRVVVLGDSVTFGTSVEQQALFPARLQEALADRGVEVLNLGAPGYDVVNVMATLEDAALDLDPDVVVYAYCFNDLGVVAGNLPYLTVLHRYDRPIFRCRVAQFAAVHIDRANLMRSNEWFRDEENFGAHYRDQIVEFGPHDELVGLQAALEARLEQVRPRELGVFIAWYTSSIRLGRLRHCLERMAELGESAGVGVVFVALPLATRDVDPEIRDIIYRILEHESTRAGFEYLDLNREFDALGASAMAVDPEDPVHLNGEGNAQVARALERVLEPRLPAVTPAAD